MDDYDFGGMDNYDPMDAIPDYEQFEMNQLFLDRDFEREYEDISEE